MLKNLDIIERSGNVENKYLAAHIISKRARQISEQKGRSLLDETRENPILLALRELAEGRLGFILHQEQNGADSDDNGRDILEEKP